MNAHQSLINELEGVIGSKEIGRRADVLRRITDLYVSGSSSFGSEQVALFDEVMCRLVGEIDKTACAAFGERLATSPNAPPAVIRTLALDDSIEVAGPVLSHSDQVDEDTLLLSAQTKSQDHLLAISRRRSLGEAVTDVLVGRGNDQVAISTAANPGARFSEGGYSVLVERSKQNEELAIQVWSRPEVSRGHLLNLFGAVSEALRVKLEAADHHKANLFRGMVAQARDQIQTQARERSVAFGAAKLHIQWLEQSGGLNEAQLLDFAGAGKFDETTLTLSLLCDLPIGLVERVMAYDRFEQLLVVARAFDFSWDTASSLLELQAKNNSGIKLDLEHCRTSFSELQTETAKKALQFYRMRERAAKPAKA